MRNAKIFSSVLEIILVSCFSFAYTVSLSQHSTNGNVLTLGEEKAYQGKRKGSAQELHERLAQFEESVAYLNSAIKAIEQKMVPPAATVLEEAQKGEGVAKQEVVRAHDSLLINIRELHTKLKDLLNLAESMGYLGEDVSEFLEDEIGKNQREEAREERFIRLRRKREALWGRYQIDAELDALLGRGNKVTSGEIAGYKKAIEEIAQGTGDKAGALLGILEKVEEAVGNLQRQLEAETALMADVAKVKELEIELSELGAEKEAILETKKDIEKERMTLEKIVNMTREQIKKATLGYTQEISSHGVSIAAVDWEPFAIEKPGDYYRARAETGIKGLILGGYRFSGMSEEQLSEEEAVRMMVDLLLTAEKAGMEHNVRLIDGAPRHCYDEADFAERLLRAKFSRAIKVNEALAKAGSQMRITGADNNVEPHLAGEGYWDGDLTPFCDQVKRFNNIAAEYSYTDASGEIQHFNVTSYPTFWYPNTGTNDEKGKPIRNYTLPDTPAVNFQVHNDAEEEIKLRGQRPATLVEGQGSIKEWGVVLNLAPDINSTTFNEELPIMYETLANVVRTVKDGLGWTKFNKVIFNLSSDPALDKWIVDVLRGEAVFMSGYKDRIEELKKEEERYETALTDVEERRKSAESALEDARKSEEALKTLERTSKFALDLQEVRGVMDIVEGALIQMDAKLNELMERGKWMAREKKDMYMYLSMTEDIDLSIDSLAAAVRKGRGELESRYQQIESAVNSLARAREEWNRAVARRVHAETTERDLGQQKDMAIKSRDWTSEELKRIEGLLKYKEERRNEEERYQEYKKGKERKEVNEGARRVDADKSFHDALAEQFRLWSEARGNLEEARAELKARKEGFSSEEEMYRSLVKRRNFLQTQVDVEKNSFEAAKGYVERLKKEYEENKVDVRRVEGDIRYVTEEKLANTLAGKRLDEKLKDIKEEKSKEARKQFLDKSEQVRDVYKEFRRYKRAQEMSPEDKAKLRYTPEYSFKGAEMGLYNALAQGFNRGINFEIDDRLKPGIRLGEESVKITVNGVEVPDYGVSEPVSIKMVVQGKEVLRTCRVFRDINRFIRLVPEMGLEEMEDVRTTSQDGKMFVTDAFDEGELEVDGPARLVRKGESWYIGVALSGGGNKAAVALFRYNPLQGRIPAGALKVEIGTESSPEIVPIEEIKVEKVIAAVSEKGTYPFLVYLSQSAYEELLGIGEQVKKYEIEKVKVDAKLVNNGATILCAQMPKDLAVFDVKSNREVTVPLLDTKADEFIAPARVTLNVISGGDRTRRQVDFYIGRSLRKERDMKGQEAEVITLIPMEEMVEGDIEIMLNGQTSVIRWDKLQEDEPDKVMIGGVEAEGRFIPSDGLQLKRLAVHKSRREAYVDIVEARQNRGIMTVTFTGQDIEDIAQRAIEAGLFKDRPELVKGFYATAAQSKERKEYALLYLLPQVRVTFGSSQIPLDVRGESRKVTIRERAGIVIVQKVAGTAGEELQLIFAPDINSREILESLDLNGIAIQFEPIDGKPTRFTLNAGFLEFDVEGEILPSIKREVQTQEWAIERARFELDKLTARLGNKNFVTIEFKDVHVDRKGFVTIRALDGSGAKVVIPGDGRPVPFTLPNGLTGQVGIENYYIETVNGLEEVSQLVFVPAQAIAGDVEVTPATKLLYRPGEKTEAEITFFIEGGQGLRNVSFSVSGAEEPVGEHRAKAKIMYGFGNTLSAGRRVLNRYYSDLLRSAENQLAYRAFNILSLIAEEKPELIEGFYHKKLAYDTPLNVPYYIQSLVGISGEYKTADGEASLPGIPVDSHQVALTTLTTVRKGRAVLVGGKNEHAPNGEIKGVIRIVERLDIEEETKETTSDIVSVADVRLAVDGDIKKVKVGGKEYLMIARREGAQTVKVYKVVVNYPRLIFNQEGHQKR